MDCTCCEKDFTAPITCPEADSPPHWREANGVLNLYFVFLRHCNQCVGGLGGGGREKHKNTETGVGVGGWGEAGRQTET